MQLGLLQKSNRPFLFADNIRMMETNTAAA